MLSLLLSSHGSKSAGQPQEQPLRMPDNSLSPEGRESREFEEGGKKFWKIRERIGEITNRGEKSKGIQTQIIWKLSLARVDTCG